MNPIRLGVLMGIRIYQRTLSLDHGLLRYVYPGGACKFHPTCSQYGYQAIERFGVARGAWLALRRVLRCHPWSMGGIDDVPTR